MRFGKKISVVIPTLNEAKNLPSLLKEMPKYTDELIVIDGYSRDSTVDIAKKHGCIVAFDKYGKGSALMKGMRLCKGDYVIMMDADWSHSAKEIDLLITGLEMGYDVCMGSRFIQGGGSSDITFIRKLGNKFFVHLVNFLYRMNYSDMCYGYRAFRRDALNRLRLRAKGFAIETEISIQSAKRGLHVLEVPSFEKTRKYGKGKLRTINDGWRILRIIIREYLE